MRLLATLFMTGLLSFGQAQIYNLSIHPSGSGIYFSTQLSPKGQSLPPQL